MASITPRTDVLDQGLYGYSDYRRTMPQVLALARALELEAAALRERNVMMRERLNVVVEQLVTARRSVWEVWNRTSSVLFATEADANKYMQMHSAAIGLIKRELPILEYVAIPDEQELK